MHLRSSRCAFYRFMSKVSFLLIIKISVRFVKINASYFLVSHRPARYFKRYFKRYLNQDAHF